MNPIGRRPGHTGISLILAGVLMGVFVFQQETALAQSCDQALTLERSMNGNSIEPVAMVLEDKTLRFTIEHIIGDKPGATGFSRGRGVNYGLSSSAYWLRVPVCNSQREPVDWYLIFSNPFVDYLQVYEVSGQQYRSLVDIKPESRHGEREIKNRKIVVPVSTAATSRSEIVIRMAPLELNLLDLTAGVWTPEKFQAKSENEAFVYGFIFGGMLILVFYNLFLFKAVRDAAYLYYVGYLIFMLLSWVAISGYGYQYLWPDSQFLKTDGPPLLTGITVFMAAIFSREFLATREKRDLNDNIAIGLAVLGLALAASSLLRLVLLTNIIIWNVTLVPIFGVIIGYRVYRSGYEPARHYILAWIFLMIGTLVFGLHGTGIIQTSLASEVSGALGALLEATFLSFALAARINLLQQQKKETETKLVQAQIEPHFLFNTLANISSLTEQDGGKARKMLADLDTYLKTTLARTRKGDTTLRQEVDLLEAYLDIIKIRMGDRLQYRIDISEKLKRLRLPPLLVQPLVENAIKHGLESRVEGGEVVVSGKIQNKQLILDVCDTGDGLSSMVTEGTGLSNVRDRLNILYGSAARLEVSENESGGVCSRLRIPV